MKVLVLTPSLYDTAPGQRFRIEQWRRYLEQEKISLSFFSFEDDDLHRAIYDRRQYARKGILTARALLRRLRVFTAIREHDLVFIHREAAAVGPALLERLIARTRVPIVYDFDDPIWLPYKSPANRWLSRLKWGGKTATICRLAGAVIVGNSLLAEYARKHSSRVYVVPSTIDLERYPPRTEDARNGHLTLGWTGSHSTLPFLETIGPALRTFAATHQFRMLVISHTDSYRMEGISDRVVARRWKANSEWADIAEIDVGLAPLPRSGWTPWRCHGKILQYMAAGVPPVASPVGVACDYIEDGANGFLAASDAEWVQKLTMLAESPVLRRQMGERARSTVEQRYSARMWAPRVREILQSAVTR